MATLWNTSDTNYIVCYDIAIKLRCCIVSWIWVIGKNRNISTISELLNLREEYENFENLTIINYHSGCYGYIRLFNMASVEYKSRNNT